MCTSGGTFMNGSTPGIDIFEVTVDRGKDAVSQSGQSASFNAGDEWRRILLFPTRQLVNKTRILGARCLFSKCRVGEVGLNGLCFPISHFCGFHNQWVPKQESSSFIEVLIMKSIVEADSYKLGTSTSLDS